MVPLEKLQERKRVRGGRDRVSVVAKGGPEAREAPAPEPEPPRAPRRFKLVNVLSRQVLAEDVGAVEALRALSGARSIVDVNPYVWEPDEDDWRPLTSDERRTLWAFRDAPK